MAASWWGEGRKSERMKYTLEGVKLFRTSSPVAPIHGQTLMQGLSQAQTTPFERGACFCLRPFGELSSLD